MKIMITKEQLKLTWEKFLNVVEKLDETYLELKKEIKNLVKTVKLKARTK